MLHARTSSRSQSAGALVLFLVFVVFLVFPPSQNSQSTRASCLVLPRAHHCSLPQCHRPSRAQPWHRRSYLPRRAPARVLVSCCANFTAAIQSQGCPRLLAG
ncbi:hypothetical protein NA56DRAFT_156072 [Hyaloscypha hepaticicola]|uniref:Secreted protein n=1 Tax=Hyaloscypha hepaticicola TaxID=2082293 RepID=A0A2J6Q3G1_9HELO|nr:hypothetical protein NA56DRAFT_156072 [Hyaloscypha hepaticicola]